MGRIVRRFHKDVYGYVVGGHLEGRENPRFVRQNRAGNGTIFKNGLSIVEELDRLVVEEEATKLKLIQIFKDAGYGTLPDGIPVEDVIFSGGERDN